MKNMFHSYHIVSAAYSSVTATKFGIQQQQCHDQDARKHFLPLRRVRTGPFGFANFVFCIGSNPPYALISSISAFAFHDIIRGVLINSLRSSSTTTEPPWLLCSSSLQLLPINIARPRNFKIPILPPPQPLPFPNLRQYHIPKLLNLRIIVQERHKQDINAQTLQQQNALDNLLLSADELRLKAIVVLHQILELRIRPHARLVACAGACVLDLSAEALDGFFVRFSLNLLQYPYGLLLGLATYNERVDSEADLAFTPGLLRPLLDVRNLIHEPFERVPVHEVDVADISGVFACVVAVAALEDLWVWAAGEGDWFGLERVVVELVEVAFEGERGFGPDAAEALDEFAAAAVAFAVVKPPVEVIALAFWTVLVLRSGGPVRVSKDIPLTDGREFGLEPAEDYIHSNATAAVVVNTADLLRCHGRCPRSW